MVGSSDIVNNLIIGIFSNKLLQSFGWSGYFIALSTLALVVLVATILFPSVHFRHDEDEEDMPPVEKEQAGGRDDRRLSSTVVRASHNAGQDSLHRRSSQQYAELSIHL